MNLQPEEQYTLLAFNEDSITEDELDEMQRLATEDMETGNRNFILETSSVVTLPEYFFPYAESLSHIIQKENGLLVIVTKDEIAVARLEAEGIVSTPTYNEAVDYVFMEELERQINEEEEQGGAE